MTVPAPASADEALAMLRAGMSYLAAARSPDCLPPYRDLTPRGSTWRCYRPDHPAGSTASKGVPLVLCLRFGLEFFLEFSFG